MPRLLPGEHTTKGGRVGGKPRFRRAPRRRRATFNPKAVRGYNRRYRKLQGRHPANLGAKLRTAGRRYARKQAQRKAAREAKRKSRATFARGLPLVGLPVFRHAARRAERSFYSRVMRLPNPARPKIGQTSEGPVLKNVGELSREFNLPKEKVSSFLTDVGNKQVAAALRQGGLTQRRYLAQRAARERSLPHGFARAAPKNVKEPGPLEAGLGASFEGAFGPGGRIASTAIAHPGEVLGTSLRTAKESITGIPQGAKQLVEHPGQALDQIAKDYERRYGPLVSGDNATFSHRLRKDYGLTPYVLDAAAFAGGVGQAAGGVARTGAAARLAAKAAEARVPLGGTLNRAVQVARAERPRLRISGGPGGAVEQPASRNLLVRGVQHRVDVARERRYAKDVQAAGGEVTPGGQVALREGAQPRQFAGLRPGKGEVLPYYSARETKTLRRYMGRTERRHGSRQSAARVAQLTEQQRVEGELRKRLNAVSRKRRLTAKEKEGFLYAVKFGLTPDPEVVRRTLTRYREMAVAARAGERDVSPLEPDELPVIDRIIANPEQYITPRLRQAASEVRDIQSRVEAGDPNLPLERAGARKLLPISRVLGEPRRPDVQHFHEQLRQIEADVRARGVEPGDLVQKFGHVGQAHPEERAALLGHLERQAAKSTREAERGLRTAERRAARVQGRVEGRNRPVRTERVRAAERDFNAAQGEVVRQERARAMPRTRRQGFTAAQVHPELGVARDRLQLARYRLRDELAHAPRVSEKLRAKAAKAQEEFLRRRTERDAARLEENLHGRVKRHFSAHPGRLEPFDRWSKRVQGRLEQAGLEAPGYFESSAGFKQFRSLRALGSGARAAGRSKAWSGARFAAAREAGDPEIFVNGVMRNIKRKASWKLVNDSMRQSAFLWSYGEHGGGLTFKEIKAYFDKHLIDEGTVELVQPRVLEDRRLDAAGLHGEIVDPHAEASSFGGVHPEDLADVHDALGAARVAYTDAEKQALRGQAQNRYLVVPKRDFEELTAAMNPSGLAGRGWDLLFRQKPARIILGTSPAWLQFQVMSNMWMSGLGRALNPFDYVGAQRFWQKLPEAQKEAWEANVGITHNHNWISQQTHLGSATNNQLVNLYRAFKQTSFYRYAHKANPFDQLFRVDEAQNNFFRRAVLYSEARKAAYARLGNEFGVLKRLQGNVVRVLDQGHHEQLVRDVLQNAPEFERHAQHVKDFLGDYLTYTSAERTNFFLRSTLFYGWLRFSLKLVFWTMPVKHPVVSAILGDLGRMGSQEIKKLLGLPAEPDGYRSGSIPAWMLAGVYFGTPAGIAGQAPGSGTVNIGRANPFLNALTQLEDPKQVLGLFSPVFQSAVDQAFTESTFRGKTWRIEGRPTPGEAERPADYFGSPWSMFNFSIPGVSKGSPRGRILERQLLDLAVPMRLWEQARFRGTQSDDALPWAPLPIRYKDKGARAAQAKLSGRQSREGAFNTILRSLAPFIGPVPSTAPGALKREREKRGAQARRGHRRRGRGGGTPWSSGGGGGGGTPWGP